MTLLSIELFGKFGARFDGHPVSGLEASKVQELLCFLLLHRTQPHSREKLAGLLWGDSSTTQSKKYLRQSLWHLQTALEPYTQTTGEKLLICEPNWIRINSSYTLWFDVQEIENAFALVGTTPGYELPQTQVEVLEKAVTLYRGDLLEGWYQDWCWYERERCQIIYLSLLDKLIAYCEMQQDYEAAINYGIRILRHDRARECTHQQLIRLYMLSGDRAAALRQFQRCSVALHEELGVTPSRATLALHEQVRADNIDEYVLQMKSLNRTLPDVMKRLERLWEHLSELEEQVREEMVYIEQALLLAGKTDQS
jgi:DNA-binding SARP family transcriptional activator